MKLLVERPVVLVLGRTVDLRLVQSKRDVGAFDADRGWLAASARGQATRSETVAAAVALLLAASIRLR